MKIILIFMVCLSSCASNSLKQDTSNNGLNRTISSNEYETQSLEITYECYSQNDKRHEDAYVFRFKKMASDIKCYRIASDWSAVMDQPSSSEKLSCGLSCMYWLPGSTGYCNAFIMKPGNSTEIQINNQLFTSHFRLNTNVILSTDSYITGESVFSPRDQEHLNCQRKLN